MIFDAIRLGDYAISLFNNYGRDIMINELKGRRIKYLEFRNSVPVFLASRLMANDIKFKVIHEV